MIATEVNDVRVCVWPSALSVDVAGNAASFTMRVTTDREADVPLPGSTEHWPIDVLVENHDCVRSPTRSCARARSACAWAS